jgi:hypothetical protein
MSKMSELYTACMLKGVDPSTVPQEELDTLYKLYSFFNHNVEHAVEAFIDGYTAEELKSKGNYPPYWIYLIWVKK